jgi:hypothetical protein
MLQARLLLVALLIPVAGAFALLGGTSIMTGATMATFESSAGIATGAMRGAMSRFASESVDAAARAATAPDVAAAIVRKALTPKAEGSLLSPAGVHGAPSFALVVDAEGAVIARTGEETKLPSSLKGLPVVAEALAGIARDGLWLEDGKPVHLAAAASYQGDVPSGAVVLGWKYNDALVARLSPDVSSVPTFVVTDSAVVGRLPEGVTESEIRAREPFGTASSGSLFPLLVNDARRFGVAVAPLYGVDTSVVAVALIDRDEAMTGVSSMQQALIGLTVLLGLLIVVIVASTLRSLSKPIDIIMGHLSQVQQGAHVGILPEAGLTGPFLRLGKQINTLIQTMPTMKASTAPLGAGGLFHSASPSSHAADGPLSFSTPPPLSGGFDGGLGGRSSALPDPLASSSLLSSASSPSFAPPPPPPPPAAPSLPSSSPSTGSGLAGLFDEPDPLAAFRVPQKSAAPSPPPPPPPAPPPPPPPESEMNPEATVMFQVPQSLLQASSIASTTPEVVAPPPKAAPPPPAPPPFAVSSANDADDNRTVVAQVPKDLLTQTAQPAHNPAEAADQAHYKEVYEKFLQTRIDCGEDTSDLSYDRFVTKLLKNRQQILEKHKAKGVRFQVYVKDGKAALRAVPVRE